MTALHWAVLLIAAQRLGELFLSRRNAARLQRKGGVEHGARHYPLFVLLHGGWLASLLALVPPATAPDWRLLGAYIALQPLRLWTIAALGENWTTRVITVPGRAPSRRGPYRLLRHPNYLIVTLEIALLPLAFGAWTLAAAFSVLNAALLARRIRIEAAAMREAASNPRERLR